MISNIAENMSGKRIAKYALLPEVAPRINNFIMAGFGNLAMFMAMVYQGVRLLPANHPYLQPGMSGQFSIRDVLREASGNIKFDLKHIDQIIIFFALIAGIIILGIQFILLLSAIFISKASAATMPSNYAGFFVTPNPEQDLALRLLDSVFGVPGIFGTNELAGGETAFHTALHGLFQFYSLGLLVIAALIMAYMIFVVVAETAQTGTPFGKRYNHAWVPIRLVVAIGLLIPISYGLNSGQWITLYAAKMGSGFATNGWILFNETLQDSYAIPDELVAKGNVPSLKDLAAFMMIAHACKQGYYGWDVESADQEYLYRDIDAYIIGADSATQANLLSTQSFPDAIQLSGNRNVLVRFGEYDPDKYPEEKGNVYPFCGEIEIIVSEPSSTATVSSTGSFGPVYDWSPTGLLNSQYFIMIINAWVEDEDYGVLMSENARSIILERLTHNNTQPSIPPDLKENIVSQLEERMTNALDMAANDLIDEIQEDDTYATLGWGGAGIWYNQIADLNGKLVNALMAKPQIKSYPSLMEYTCKENQQQNENVQVKDCYNPVMAQGKPVEFVLNKDAVIAKALNDVFAYWHEDQDGVTGNAFIDTINAIFGTQGLFDMCENANTHPLAQLSTMGKGLVEAAIRNLGFALGTGVAGVLAPYIGPSLQAASGFFMTVASIGILIGFLLFYLVPFMPFLYFLFAVGGWVKGLFEAMVGIPLWALAHIRIDGQGLPGDGAVNGYFLIFEIFIRPILIVFGLIASILIFGAMIKVLNEVFSIVVANLSGNDPDLATSCGGGNPTEIQASMQTSTADMFRGPIDEFFYTIVYAILVYMIGMASFKLIDLIPNNILRWMGQGVQTFNDQAGEPAEGLMTKMAVGGSLMGGQLQQAGSGLGQALKQGGSGVANLVTK